MRGYRMNQISDFKRSFEEAYRNGSISIDESYQISLLTNVISEYANKMTRSEMYEEIYNIYIEEQHTLVNKCLDLISGWDQVGQFEFLGE